MAILPKYEPHFEKLDQEHATYLAQAMELPEADQIAGHDIYEIGNELGMDQADVVMTLATDPSLPAITIVETLIGKKITRKQVHVVRSSGPRRTVSVRKSDPRKIVHVVDNPKKPGSESFGRFALYKVGMTVDEFIAAGGTMGDVKWDAERSFIKFEGDA